MRRNTDAQFRDGAACSSVEAPVMGVERRGSVTQLIMITNSKEDDLM